MWFLITRLPEENVAFKFTTIQQQSKSLSSIKKVITLWNWRCSFNYNIVNELREKTAWLSSSTHLSQSKLHWIWVTSLWITSFPVFLFLFLFFPPSYFPPPFLPSLSFEWMSSNITLALKSAISTLSVNCS